MAPDEIEVKPLSALSDTFRLVWSRKGRSLLGACSRLVHRAKWLRQFAAFSASCI